MRRCLHREDRCSFFVAHEQMRIFCHICRKADGGIMTQCRVGSGLSELQAGKGEQKGEGLMVTEL